MPLENDVSFTLQKNGDAKDVVLDATPGPPVGDVQADSVRVYTGDTVDMTKPATIQRSIETLLRAAKSFYAVSTGVMALFIVPGGASSTVVVVVPGNTNYVSLEIGANLANSAASGLVAETTHQIANVIAEEMKDN